MNKDDFNSATLRKAITYFAGVLVTKGLLKPAFADETIIDAVISLGMIFWSYYLSHKNIKQLKTDAIAGTTGGAVGTPAVSSGDATTGSAPRTVGDPTTGP